MPPPTDPKLFRRCQIVHVDMALLIWNHAFLATLAPLRAAVPAQGLQQILTAP